MGHSPARSALEVGSVIADTYTLEQLIGRGGMGAVFLASHARLPGKQVAIKVLHAEVADDETLARFRHEATIASQLNHPNIVEVHDFNVMPDGTPYLVLEYLEGETLAQRLRGGPIPLDHALSIMREVGSALAAAHRNGVIHRDLKPQNIFLVRTEIDGRTTEVAKVLDFGISKMRSSQTVKTQDNSLLGTPQYMSPEQAVGQHTKVDERTDVFALGSILYEMLCGHPAFSGESIPEVVFKVVYEQPQALRERAPATPADVTTAIEQAMSKTADERFATVGGFVEALTGEPLAPPSVSGQHAAIDGSGGSWRASRSPSRAQAMPAAGPAGQTAPPLGSETQGPGVARADKVEAPARAAGEARDRTVVGVSVAPGPVSAGGATMASISEPSRPPPDSLASPPPAAPVVAPPTVVTPPVVAAPAPRSRVPLIAALAVAVIAGGVAVYFATRAGGQPPVVAHADASTARPDAAPLVAEGAPIDAAAAPLDAAGAAPLDAAGAAVAAPKDAAVVAARADAMTHVAPAPADAAAPEPVEPEPGELQAGEQALRGKSWDDAIRDANTVIRDPAAKGRPRLAHALAIHGIAGCGKGEPDTIARVDLTALTQLPARVAAPARARIIRACKDAGYLDDL